MNQKDLTETLIHAYVGIASALPETIDNPNIDLEIGDREMSISIVDGLTGQKQEYTASIREIEDKISTLQQKSKEENLQKDLNESDSPAGGKLVQEVMNQ